MKPAPREARLRPEFASLYPKLVPGRWVLASFLIPVVERERRRTGFVNPLNGGGRVLLEEHFEFRGGTPRGPSWSGPKSRASD